MPAINHQGGAEPGPALLGDYLHYFRLAWHRKSLIMLGAAVGLVLGTLYYVQREPVYESDAEVLVVNKRPDSGMGGNVHLSHFEDYVSTHRILVRSPLIVERAIEKYHLEKLVSLADEEDLVDALIERLSVRRSTKDSSSKQNSILSLAFRGNVADECGVVVNAVVNSYKEFLDETYRNMSDDTLKLITDARDTLTKDLAEKEEAYRIFREKCPLLWRGKDEVNPHHDRLAKIEEKRSALLLRRNELEGRLATVRKAVAENRSREEIVAIISDLARDSEFFDPDRNPETRNLETQLLPLLLEEQTLLGEYGSQHPQLLSVRKRIEATRQFFALPSASYSRIVPPGETDSPKELVSLVTGYLEHEVDRLKSQEAALKKLFDEEHETARNLSIYEIQDEQFRSRLARTQELCDGIIKRLQDVSFVKDYGGFEARIIAPAGIGVKVSPKAAYVFPGGLFFGLMSGFGLALVAELADKRFRTPDEVRSRLGLPVIGEVPFRMPEEGDVEKKLAGVAPYDPMLCTYYAPMSAWAEAYRGLRTAMYFSTNGEGHKTIQITSPNMGEGKSTISANLAVSIAQSGKRVVLVDADLRKPRQHDIFGLDATTGLAAVVNGEVELADALYQTDITGLSVLPCGPIPPNPAELLTSPRFEQLLAVLREKFDYVLVDTPPVLAVSDPCVVAPRVDAVLLVISISRNGRSEAQRAKELLGTMEVNLLGTVVNRVTRQAGGAYGYGSYRYERYGYMAHYYREGGPSRPVPGKMNGSHAPAKA